jgi:molybdopterin-containing oxidoreductase family iron-sulfur binding subunit
MPLLGKYTEKPPLNYETVEEMTNQIKKYQEMYGEQELSWSQQKEVLKALMGQSANLPEQATEAVANARKQLEKAGRKAVVITGLPDVEAQSMVLSINESLGSEIMDAAKPRRIRQGKTTEV